MLDRPEPWASRLAACACAVETVFAADDREYAQQAVISATENKDWN